MGRINETEYQRQTRSLIVTIKIFQCQSTIYGSSKISLSYRSQFKTVFVVKFPPPFQTFRPFVHVI
jgi:hypothetical protein